VDGTATVADQASDEARRKAEKIRRLEDQLRFADIPGFFPTPAATIERMLDRAQIAPGNTVLEPSAGTGSIADAIKARVPSLPDGPGVLVMCCERMTRLRDILREKGHALTEADDFMEMPAAGEFDRVLMNPPFEKQQDIDHVRRAFDHLKPGGRLVAIVGAGAFSRGNRKATEFREWLDRSGAMVEDLNGAFSTPDAFRRTAVAAKLVTIDKQPADTPPSLVTTPKPRPMTYRSRRQVPEEAAGSTIPPAESPPNATPSVPMAQPSRGGMSLVAKYRPATLSAVIGQKPVVDALRAFSRAPAPAAFIFAGAPGVGKTAAAEALAADLGCAGDFGGLTEIPSGTQDGKAVESVLRSLRLTPLGGSGWKVVIINEADRMTDQAEAMWLDGLEHLPAKSVVIFTTNNLSRMTPRLIRRCEVYQFDSTSETFRMELARFIDMVWHQETGRPLDVIPEGLGKFELGSDDYSIGLALQQIAPYVRTSEPLPASFAPPIIRGAYGHGKAMPAAPKAIPNPLPGKSTPPRDDATALPHRSFCRVCRQWAKKGSVMRPTSDGGWKHAAC
jgi:protein-L-isoaspartate O-methyltransferase